jgi:hypothetical protein
MAFNYTSPVSFKPPKRVLPSADYRGESSTAPIHQAVGRALSSWEHAESAWAKAFQLFCEARSLAAVRVFGTIESVASKSYALRFAALEFFAARSPADAKLTKATSEFCSESQVLRRRGPRIESGIARARP